MVETTESRTLLTEALERQTKLAHITGSKSIHKARDWQTCVAPSCENTQLVLLASLRSTSRDSEVPIRDCGKEEGPDHEHGYWCEPASDRSRDSEGHDHEPNDQNGCTDCHRLAIAEDRRDRSTSRDSEVRLIDTHPAIGGLTALIELEIGMHNPVGAQYECDCGDQIKGETFNRHVASMVDYRLTATDGDA